MTSCDTDWAALHLPTRAANKFAEEILALTNNVVVLHGNSG
jgi:hypothetical protein